MNKKILTIGSSGLAVVLLVLTVTIMNNAGNAQTETQEFLSESPMLPPPTPIKEILAGGPVDNILMANSMVEYDVKSPFIPEGYDLQLINSDPYSLTTTMLLSEYPVKDDTTRSEFFAQKGILIFMQEKTSPNFEKDSWMAKWVEQRDGKRITINGNPGVMHDITSITYPNGETNTNPAQVIFFKDSLLVEVKGIVDTAELIKIAESL